MNEQEQHRLLREQLGSYALGHLSAAEGDRLRAHLDGCAECRAELDEIAPLRALLDSVDPDRFETPPTPPVGLGDQIRTAIGAEQGDRDADELASRRGRARGRVLKRVQVLGAAAAVVLLALGGGAYLGRETAPELPVLPREAIALDTVGNTDVVVESANLIPHTWGVELEIVASGFDQGETFRAAFRDDEGNLTPAGEFIGTGGATMSCHLQSAELRDSVTEVVVTDASGKTVLVSDIDV